MFAFLAAKPVAELFVLGVVAGYNWAQSLDD